MSDTGTKGDASWGSLGTWGVNTSWDTPYGWKAPCTKHAWVDTGMKWTFCKECDQEGELDPMTGDVKLVFRPKEEKK